MEFDQVCNAQPHWRLQQCHSNPAAPVGRSRGLALLHDTKAVGACLLFTN
jgi:hypothetical protein